MTLAAAGTNSFPTPLTWMDRLFLAVIISGLLVVATAMSLLVLPNDSVTLLRPPPAPSMPTGQVRPRPMNEDGTELQVGARNRD